VPQRTANFWALTAAPTPNPTTAAPPISSASPNGGVENHKLQAVRADTPLVMNPEMHLATNFARKIQVLHHYCKKAKPFRDYRSSFNEQAYSGVELS